MCMILYVIKQTIEENIQLEKENKRLRGLVEDYDKWARDMNGRYQENIASVFKAFSNN